MANSSRFLRVPGTPRRLAAATILGVCIIGAVSIARGSRVEATADGDRLGRRLVGRQDDGSVVITTNQVLTPAGRQVEFRGRPLAVALQPGSPHGRVPQRRLSGAHRGGRRLVDREAGVHGRRRQRLVHRHPLLARRAHALRLAGERPHHRGERGHGRHAHAQPLHHDAAKEHDPVSRPRRRRSTIPAGSRCRRTARRLYVVLSRNNSLAVVDLATNSVLAEIPVGNAPHAVVVVGDRAYVTNQGGRRARGGDFTNDSSGTDIVASARSGHRGAPARSRSSISRPPVKCAASTSACSRRPWCSTARASSSPTPTAIPCR